ncbi:MAG: PTS sugar transporter subunit IIA [Chthoniobacterales bacterium]|nr:PTS sugar transporter subunit IIA [Chthoniobacterales bacterium]
MPATLADLLEERHITLDLRSEGREEALREIISLMKVTPAVVDAEKFLQEVLAREEAHTTFMGDGVAFPHARTDLVTRIVLGAARSRDGVPFGENGEPAHLIFVIGVPTRMVTDYLVCVGALARITKDPANRAALMDAETAAEFSELLRAASLLLE